MGILDDILRGRTFPFPFPVPGPQTQDRPRSSGGSGRPPDYLDPDRDPWDTLAQPAAPSTTADGDLAQNQSLNQAITDTQARDCVDCPECGFLRDGRKVNSFIRFTPALNYQDRVVRLLGMFNPPFTANFATNRTEEWQMPDAGSGTGVRPMDGLNGMRCFLIEAKLGYAGYLESNWGSNIPAVGDGRRAQVRMAAVLAQARKHHALAMRYPNDRGALDGHVVWGCSQLILVLYINGIMGPVSRVRAFHIPGGMLPSSNW